MSSGLAARLGLIHMSSASRALNEVKLSSGCTVGGYRALEKNQDRAGIANFIEQRFVERYITPIMTSAQRNGFSTVAVSCLMIEALESFWRGWPNTLGKSELSFCSFFQRTPALAIFHGQGPEFYKHVRCGILHQAETTGGWRIRKTGPLFDPPNKTVGSNALLAVLRAAIGAYVAELRLRDWNDPVWVNFRKKMNSVCANCQ